MGLRQYYPRGSASATPTRGVVAQADSDGGVQGVSWGIDTDDSAEVLPSDDLDTCSPYGFWAVAAAGTEYTEMMTSAGPVVVGYRAAAPITLAAGESCHAFDANCYAHAKSGEYDIKSALVKAHNGGAVDFVALAAKVLTELGKIETAFNAHTHAIGGVTPGAGAGTCGPGPTYTKASVATTVLKAE